ncbi:MAG: arsenite methyltransferase [Dehalococcoidales bacterium]|nr:arsenite methyltransferase [Dehalococcoidales bacterium]
MNTEEVQKIVRERYGKIAVEQGSCCCGPDASSSSCCNAGSEPDISEKFGYSKEDINMVPEGSNLGLGCGNPVALASLKEGETVLDLGSGAGFDCFLAASRVGPKGNVIGIDMTGEMLDRARENARKGGFKNVEFRLGEIENLPVADSSVDAVISNCVINLSSNKQRVFDEAFRVLKPGGRLMISDIVLLKELPESILNSIDAYTGCIAGAIKKDDYLQTIKASGFESVKVVEESGFSSDCVTSAPESGNTASCCGGIDEEGANLFDAIASVRVQGIKPAKSSLKVKS